MRKVIVAWYEPRRSKHLEDAVPLRFLGEHARSQGYRTEIDVVFLAGLDLLAGAYREDLEGLGYSLHDGSAIFQRVAADHPTLRRFGEFEFFCFMRWLVLWEFYGGGPLLHFDGDIVFNESPEVLATLFGGRNLVVQGCPAVTSIHDCSWFRAYAGEVRTFADSVEDYSSVAWEERRGWEASRVEKWAGSRRRRVISSDQDLLSHLIHTDRIPQDPPSAFRSLGSRYVVVENPLHLGELDRELPLTYARRAGIDHFSEKRMMFWHMQSDWCRYLSRYMTRERLGVDGPTRRLALQGRVDGVIRRLARRLSPRRSRLELYRRFFQAGDFRGIFREGVWWQEGTFA